MSGAIKRYERKKIGRPNTKQACDSPQCDIQHRNRLRCKLGNDGLSGDENLHDETDRRNHSETGILEFFQLKFLRVLLAHTEWVKSVVSTALKCLLEGGEFDDGDSDEDLNPAFDGDGINSLERVWFGEGWSGQMNDFLHEHSETSEHGNSAVLQFAGAGVVEIDVVGEVQRVESDVTDTGAVKL